MSKNEFRNWLEMKLYLASRDCAVIETKILTEVFENLYDYKPDLKKIEETIMEKSNARR